MFTRFCMMILKVRVYTARRYVHFIRKEDKKTSLSANESKKTMKCCHFQSYPCWWNKGWVVLKGAIDHVWLQGKVWTSILMTYLISGTMALLLTTTATLPPKIFLLPKKYPYHNWNRVKVGDRKESFARGNQTIYTTPKLISIIILVRR